MVNRRQPVRRAKVEMEHEDEEQVIIHEEDGTSSDGQPRPAGYENLDSRFDGRVCNIIELTERPAQIGWSSLHLPAAQLLHRLNQHLITVNSARYAKVPRFYEHTVEGRVCFSFGFVTCRAAATLLLRARHFSQPQTHKYAAPVFLQRVPDCNTAHLCSQSLVSDDVLDLAARSDGRRASTVAGDHSGAMANLMTACFGKGRHGGQKITIAECGVTLFSFDSPNNRMVQLTDLLSQRATNLDNDPRCAYVYGKAANGEQAVMVSSQLSDTLPPQYALTRLRKRSLLPGNEPHVCYLFSLRNLHCVGRAADGRTEYRLQPADMYLVAFQSFDASGGSYRLVEPHNASSSTGPQKLIRPASPNGRQKRARKKYQPQFSVSDDDQGHQHVQMQIVDNSSSELGIDELTGAQPIEMPATSTEPRSPYCPKPMAGGIAIEDEFDQPADDRPDERYARLSDAQLQRFVWEKRARLVETQLSQQLKIMSTVARAEDVMDRLDDFLTQQPVAYVDV